MLGAQHITGETLLIGHPIHTLAELEQQIHDDLRSQHPEWVGPNGESPMCDFYETRLHQLLRPYEQSIRSAINADVREEEVAAAH